MVSGGDSAEWVWRMLIAIYVWVVGRRTAKELTCKFVELYKQHLRLWDMNSAVYRRKDKRQRALEEVVREMALGNFTTEDAKQKIKSLRGTY
jgi:hypothetical protein